MNHHREHIWSSTYSHVLAKTGDPEQAAEAADKAVARFHRGTGAAAEPVAGGDTEDQRA